MSEDWKLVHQTLSANLSPVTMFDLCEGLVRGLCSCLHTVRYRKGFSRGCMHKALRFIVGIALLQPVFRSGVYINFPHYIYPHKIDVCTYAKVARQWKLTLNALFSLTCNHAHPPPPDVSPGIFNLLVSWWSISHPRASRKRQFPIPELLIELIYVCLGTSF